jgi:hypothetical protein
MKELLLELGTAILEVAPITFVCQKIPTIRTFNQENRVKVESMELSIKQMDPHLTLYTNTTLPVLSVAPLDPSTSCFQGKSLAQQTGHWSTPDIL